MISDRPNRDTGYEKLSIFSSVQTPQPPSNVTRIARSLRRQCTDGTVQIIEYQSGVGSDGSWLDSFTGGAFGKGVSEVSTEHKRPPVGSTAPNLLVEYQGGVLFLMRQLR